MKTSDSGLHFIRQQEGLARWDPAKQLCFPYLDQIGKLTIGVGHLIRSDEDFTDGITEEQVMQLLATDVQKCERAINQYVTVPLTQNRFDVLADWSFNCGVGVLSNSTLVRRLNLGYYSEVPILLCAWNKGDGKELPVLTARRRAEGQIWNEPNDLSLAEIDAVMATVAQSLASEIDVLTPQRSEDNP